MVSISCFSYAARKALQHFIGPRNEVVSAMGAFVIGYVKARPQLSLEPESAKRSDSPASSVLGNVYARVFKGK